MTSMDDVGWDCGEFLQHASQTWAKRNLQGEFEFTLRACALKRLWAIVHGLLYGLIQKAW